MCWQHQLKASSFILILAGRLFQLQPLPSCSGGNPAATLPFSHFGNVTWALRGPEEPQRGLAQRPLRCEGSIRPQCWVLSPACRRALGRCPDGHPAFTHHAHLPPPLPSRKALWAPLRDGLGLGTTKACHAQLPEPTDHRDHRKCPQVWSG